MADILKTVEDYNPKNGLKNIYAKLIEIIAKVNTLWSSSVAQPKVYKALLTQSGTSAPVVVSNGTGANTPLVNTLGATPSYSYDTTGEFYLNCVGMFPDQAKVIINCPPLNGTNDEGVRIAWNDSDSLYIQTFKAGANFNGLLNYYSVIIEVYP